MRDILDLDHYPLDKPGSPAWHGLVEQCRADLAQNGMFSKEEQIGFYGRAAS